MSKFFAKTSTMTLQWGVLEEKKKISLENHAFCHLILSDKIIHHMLIWPYWFFSEVVLYHFYFCVSFAHIFVCEWIYEHFLPGEIIMDSMFEIYIYKCVIVFPFNCFSSLPSTSFISIFAYLLNGFSHLILTSFIFVYFCVHWSHHNVFFLCHFCQSTEQLSLFWYTVEPVLVTSSQ